MKLFIIIALFLSASINAQCNTKINNRPDGNIIEYFNPVPIAILDSYEIGTSVYKNKTTDSYSIGITILVKTVPPMPIDGSLNIKTTNTKGLSLPLITSNTTNYNGNVLIYALYTLSETNLYQLKSYPITQMYFNMAGQTYGASISQNKEVYKNQLSCLW